MSPGGPTGPEIARRSQERINRTAGERRKKEEIKAARCEVKETGQK